MRNWIKVILGIFFLIIFCFFLCCKTSKEVIPDKIAIICPIKTSFPVTGQMSMLIKEYCDIDENISKDSLKIRLEYLAKKYYLRQMSDTCFYLCGFAKTDSLFDEKKYKARDIKINNLVEGYKSLCMPISQMKFFFTQKDIISFEPDIPVKLLSPQ